MIKKITWFELRTTVREPKYISDLEVFELIRNGYSKEVVENVRKAQREKDGDAKDHYKSLLPLICFSGTFKVRSNAGILNHSGKICLDYDKLQNVDEAKERFKKDPYVYAAFLSPSGNGIKVIVKIPPSVEDHKAHFLALDEYFGLDSNDPQMKAVSQGCYMSFDPDIYINVNSKVFTKKIEPEIYDYGEKVNVIPLKDEAEIVTRILVWMEKSGMQFTEGNRHHFIKQFLSACCRYGISDRTAEGYVFRDFKGLPEKEVTDMLKWTYANCDFGVSYFEDKQIIREAQKKAENGLTTEQIRAYLNTEKELDEPTAKAVIDEVQTIQARNREHFWDIIVDPKTMKVKIDFNRVRFLDWCHDHGFSRKENGEGWELLKEDSKQLEIVMMRHLKDYVFDYVDNLPAFSEHATKIDIKEFLARGVKTYFSKEYIELIKPFQGQMMKDTETECYLYWSGSAVRITADNIDQISYKDIPHNIWKSHIKEDRPNIPIVEDWENDYSRFCRKVMGDDPNRFEGLKTHIGYLLHGYKTKKTVSAVILYDEIISEHPEGGTGKGLLLQGIGKVKRLCTIDGQNFKFDKAFSMQRVEMDTEIIVFEDAHEKFEFTKLFSMLTEGVTVEKKNKGEFFIPFEDSPKIVITSNYIIKGQGNSNNRRKEEIEFSQYFNSTKTPFEYFGRMLFDDWDDTEWIKFYNFMFHCVQCYLKRGIVKIDEKNLSMKRFIACTCPEFIEFMPTIEMEYTYERSVLKERFTNTYPERNRTSTRKFNEYLQEFAKFFNMPYGEDIIQGMGYATWRSGNDFFVHFSDVSGDFQKYLTENGLKKDEEMPF